MLKLVLAMVGALLLTGCKDLVTTYGDRQFGSVNGFKVLHARLDERFELRELPRLGKRVGDADLLVHCSPWQGMPDSEGLDWICDWLDDGDGRQAVVILRNGSISPWLCRRWADEIRAELPKADEQRRPILEQQIDRLLTRAAEEDEPEAYYLANPQNSEHFSLTPLPTSQVFRLSGLIEAEAPDFFTAPVRLQAEQGTSLITADGDHYAVEIPVGRGRLVVLAHAIPLLDGAQVDGVCRRLLAALIDDLAAHGAAKALWVRRLSIGGDEDPQPPNILSLLFGRFPFNGIVIHLLVVVVAFLVMRALWLGRTEPLAREDLQRFDRHVAAFAFHLRRAHATRRILDALASVLRKPAPPAGGDAFAAARGLYGPPSEKTPPSSTAPSDQGKQQ